MKDSNLKCLGRVACSSPVVIACNYRIPVVLLCEGCISNHVLEPCNHRLIRPNQAQQLLSSSS